MKKTIKIIFRKSKKKALRWSIMKFIPIALAFFLLLSCSPEFKQKVHLYSLRNMDLPQPTSLKMPQSEQISKAKRIFTTLRLNDRRVEHKCGHMIDSTPDGRYIACPYFGYTGDLFLFDPSTPNITFTNIKFAKNFNFGLLGNPSALCISRNGSLLAAIRKSHGELSTVKVWKTREHKLAFQFKVKTNPRVKYHPLTFSSDSSLLAVGSGKKIYLYSTRTQNMICELVTNTPIEIISLAFSPNSQLLACGGRFDDTIEIWSIPDRTCINKLHSNITTQNPNRSFKIKPTPSGYQYFYTGVEELTFTPDGNLLLAGIQFFGGKTQTGRNTYKSQILVWNTVDWALKHNYGLSSKFTLSGDGTKICAVNNKNNNLVVLKLGEWKPLCTIPVKGKLLDMHWLLNKPVLATVISRENIKHPIGVGIDIYSDKNIMYWLEYGPPNELGCPLDIILLEFWDVR